MNAFFILVFSFLVFVPIKYLYPSRSPILRGPTIGLGILWGILVLATIYLLPHPPMLLVYASLLYPAYYLILSLWVSTRRTLQ
jgi:phosphatidylcholine synthase